MKRSITLLSALIGVASVAAGETLWVYGVNEETGWYDADKTGSGDSALCWAAVSSNLINWWQNQYVIPSNVPTGDAVWTTYRASVNNVYANTQVGVEWWLTGDGGTIYGMEFFKPTWNGGYYTAYESDPYSIYFDEQYVYHTTNNSALTLSSTLYSALSSGSPRIGIGVNVGSSPTYALHGITLWGAEFDENRTLTALWLTDSDDAVNSVGDQDLFKVDVEYKDDHLYLSNYWFASGRYVESLTIFDASQTDAWGMERVYINLPAIPVTHSIPEPATATLSLAALVALSARRRRK